MKHKKATKHIRRPWKQAIGEPTSTNKPAESKMLSTEEYITRYGGVASNSALEAYTMLDEDIDGVQQMLADVNQKIDQVMDDEVKKQLASVQLSQDHLQVDFELLSKKLEKLT